MKSLRQLPKWQTAIQLCLRPALRGFQRPNLMALMALPIRLVHATITGVGGPRAAEVVEGVEGVEGVEEIKAEATEKALGQKTKASRRAGPKWAGQTISRHVYVEYLRLSN
jgi:hypothetical protein